MSIQTGTALLTKIANMMSNPESGQIVSFLTLAEGWDMREIAFDLPSSITGISERDSVNLRGTFARQANSIPASINVWSSSGTYLWDIYREILKGTVEFAESPTSDTDKQKVQSARILIGPPGQPTTLYQAYLNFKEKCSTLEQSLRHAQMTMNNTTDPTISAKAKTDCDKLLEQLEFCNQEWTVNGYKKEVESALVTIYESSVNTQWRSWEEDFDRVGSQNDSYGTFWPTGYSPDRLFDQGSGWIKFTLTGTEVATLSASASPRSFAGSRCSWRCWKNRRGN
ncbi:hypothetical protein ACFTQL_23815 [Peribacillus butanolivorans]|uniref:hypothetical protein n=1 Tax=Peribacillus butanolivorans TaxID=421767 RepID=UPI0036318D44